MADIKFLQDINFTGVTSKNFVVESIDAANVTTGPVKGQIILDTTSSADKLAYYDGTKWVQVPSGSSTYTWSLDGDTNPGSTVTINAANTVDIAGGVGISTALTSSGGNLATLTVTNDKPFDKVIVSDGTNTTDITNNDTITFTGAGGVTVAESAGTITITGPSGTMSSFKFGDGTQSATVSNQDTVTVQSGTSGSIIADLPNTSAATLNIDVEYGTNTANKNVVTAASATSTVTTASQLLIENSDSGAAGTSSVGRITWGTLKDDVIGGISGAMSFKGAYDNSSTNGSPNIGGGQGNASSGSGTTGTDLEPGDTYVVSAVGTVEKFLNVDIEVGDLIIFSKTSAVNSGGTVSASNFTIVNRNIDLATTTTAGIVSVPTAGGLDIATSGASAGQISIADQTNLPQGAQGTATKVPTITVNAKGIVTALSETTITANTGKTKFGANSGGGTTQLTFVHNLNDNVIVQAWELADAGATTLTGAHAIYPDIEIKNSNEVYLNFAAAAQANRYAVTCTPCPV